MTQSGILHNTYHTTFTTVVPPLLYSV